MSTTDKIQTAVLFMVGGVLLGVLLTSWYYNTEQVRTWEDGSYVGCQHGGKCED